MRLRLQDGADSATFKLLIITFSSLVVILIIIPFSIKNHYSDFGFAIMPCVICIILVCYAYLTTKQKNGDLK